MRAESLRGMPELKSPPSATTIINTLLARALCLLLRVYVVA